MTTALGEKIKAIIQANGPISVTDYFSLCLADPEHGYYRTREPFGRSGDFVTAPEVSQIFGEMIGVFIVHAWQRHGTPTDVRLVEIGPGRGTMMADMLRVISRIAPPLFDAMTVHLVETSERLRDVQSQTLEPHGEKITWHDGFDEVPPGFTLIAANELFDAIPIRQFIRMPTGFRERMVGIDADGELTFAVRRRLPRSHLAARTGAERAGRHALRDLACPPGGDDGDLRAAARLRRHGTYDRLRPSRHRLRRYAAGRAHA